MEIALSLLKTRLRIRCVLSDNRLCTAAYDGAPLNSANQFFFERIPAYLSKTDAHQFAVTDHHLPSDFQHVVFASRRGSMERAFGLTSN